jgi:hypothetical protein
MHIKVGPFCYEIIARAEPIEHPDGGLCHGVAWPDLHRVEFSLAAPPHKRVAVLWHELMHLAKADFDIHGAELLGEEAVCNLLGLLMSMISPMDMLRLQIYASEGVDAPAAMCNPWMGRPVPILHFSRQY